MSDTSDDRKAVDAAKARMVRHMSKKHLATGGFQDLKKDDFNDEKLAKKPVKTKLAGWKHFVAGGVAGACEVLATMPLDVIKTQMQINPGKYTGPIDAFMKIGSHSPKNLYFGLNEFLLQTSAKAAIRFYGFSQCKELTTRAIGDEAAEKNQVLVNLVSGLGAGSMEAMIWTTPTERLKVLRQTEANVAGTKKYNSMAGTARIVVQEQGIRGLFVGVVPCVIRQASSVGFRFMCYQPVKDGLMWVTGKKEENVATHMGAGATVGALSVILNNPVDVIKNIQQSGNKEGVVKIAGDIMKTDGLKGFTRGLSARVPRVGAAQAITFGVYEQMAKLLLNV